MERARRKKGGEGKKTIVLLSGFILATFEMAKTTSNPARYNDACIKNIMILVTS